MCVCMYVPMLQPTKNLSKEVYIRLSQKAFFYFFVNHPSEKLSIGDHMYVWELGLKNTQYGTCDNL